LKSKKLFVDGRTDVRADIFSPLILLGRLLEVDLTINFKNHQISIGFSCIKEIQIQLHLAEKSFSYTEHKQLGCLLFTIYLTRNALYSSLCIISMNSCHRNTNAMFHWCCDTVTSELCIPKMQS